MFSCTHATSRPRPTEGLGKANRKLITGGGSLQHRPWHPLLYIDSSRLLTSSFESACRPRWLVTHAVKVNPVLAVEGVACPCCKAATWLCCCTAGSQHDYDMCPGKAAAGQPLQDEHCMQECCAEQGTHEGCGFQGKRRAAAPDAVPAGVL
jgi:hypothetical protein